MTQLALQQSNQPVSISRSGMASEDVVQQVNLLTDDLLPARPVLDFQQLLLGWGGVVLLLLFLSAYNAFEIAGLRSDEMGISAKLKQLQQATAVIKASFDSKVDLVLVQDVTHLRQRVQGQQQLLARLSNGNQIQRQGFSAYLSDISRNHVDGLWFTRIHFMAGGDQILLSGKTLEPYYVPRFLQKLARDSRFVGHEFDRFELRTEAGEADARPGGTVAAQGVLTFTITGPNSELEQ